MRHIREFRSNFENISRDCRAIVARLSHDSRATFVRVSHDFPANVSILILIRTTVARHLFSRQIVTSFSHVVSRLSRDRDIRTSVAKISHCKFAKISRRQVRDIHTNVVQPSHDSLAKYFGKKICIQFLNMFKTFSTSSRLVRDT